MPTDRDLQIKERALLRERRPPPLRPPHARALPLPRKQRARKLAGRRMLCVDRAREEEPVACEHVKIKVLEVVLAARQVGEEAARVVVVARVDADLREHSGVDEADVPQVAVEEGEGGEALRVGEHRRNEDDARLLVRPPLLVRAADHAEDLAPRVEGRHD